MWIYTGLSLVTYLTTLSRGEELVKSTYMSNGKPPKQILVYHIFGIEPRPLLLLLLTLTNNISSANFYLIIQFMFSCQPFEARNSSK
jgi:hypothetical protein